MREPDTSSSRNPKVSVVIPVHDGEGVIRRAVQSVLGQRYDNLEVVVVDDGSTDRTLVELESIQDPRLTLERQDRRGAAAARNRGFDASAGEFIAFLDADDRWFPDKISGEVDALVGSQDPVGIAYSGYYAVDNRDRLVKIPPCYDRSGDISGLLLDREGVLLPSNTLLHRRVFEDLGGFPERLRYHEDRPFFLQAARRFPCQATGKRRVVYRQTIGGKARRILRDFESALGAQLLVLDSVRDVLKDDERRTFERTCMNGLFSRFAMYGYLDSAARMSDRVDRSHLVRSPKGLLAYMSVASGVNLLALARVVSQGISRFALNAWWQKKAAVVLRPRREMDNPHGG
ncbi:glycosyltransferase family 2 protein [Gemmatimonadota bacterium]